MEYPDRTGDSSTVAITSGVMVRTTRTPDASLVARLVKLHSIRHLGEMTVKPVARKV